jgi:ADP-ribose pyrophosphatase
MEDQYVTVTEPSEGQTFFRVERTRSVCLDTGREYVRNVVRHPGGSAVVPLNGSSAVCVEQYRPAVGRVVIEIPGGRPHAGETPLETARRELREETGLGSDHYEPLARCWGAPDFSDWEAHLYVANGLYQVSRIPDDEIPTRLCVVPLSQVESLVAQGMLVDAKTIVGLLLARNWIEGKERYQPLISSSLTSIGCPDRFQASPR